MKIKYILFVTLFVAANLLFIFGALSVLDLYLEQMHFGVKLMLCAIAYISVINICVAAYQLVESMLEGRRIKKIININRIDIGIKK